MSVRYYKEPNGDFMRVDWRARWKGSNGEQFVDVRAASFEHNAASVQTTGAQIDYVKTCKRVNKVDVPTIWHTFF